MSNVTYGYAGTVGELRRNLESPMTQLADYLSREAAKLARLIDDPDYQLADPAHDDF